MNIIRREIVERGFWGSTHTLGNDSALGRVMRYAMLLHRQAPVKTF